MQLLLSFSKGVMKNRPGWTWKHPTSPPSRPRPIWEVFLEPPTMHDAEGGSAHALLGTSCAVSPRREVPLTVAVPDLLPSASQRDRGWFPLCEVKYVNGTSAPKGRLLLALHPTPQLTL